MLKAEGAFEVEASVAREVTHDARLSSRAEVSRKATGQLSAEEERVGIAWVRADTELAVNHLGRSKNCEVATRTVFGGCSDW